MAKNKTRKSAQKRFKVTKKGKILHAGKKGVVLGRRVKKIKRMLGR